MSPVYHAKLPDFWAEWQREDHVFIVYISLFQRQYYSCFLSDLVFEWQRGSEAGSDLVFKDLTAFVRESQVVFMPTSSWQVNVESGEICIQPRLHLQAW